MQSWKPIVEPQLLPRPGTEESDLLDFKEQPWHGSDSGLEIARDVAQFANHLGGTILIGASEDGSDRLLGYVSIGDAPAVAQRVIDVCYAALSPRVEVDARVIVQSLGVNVVVVNVPAYDGVVAIKLKGVERWEFYRRVGKGKKPFSFEEVEAMWTDGRRGRMLLNKVPEDGLRNVRLDVTEGHGVALSNPASIRKDADHFQVNYGGRCFNFPYEWVRAVWPAAEGGWSVSIAVRFQLSQYNGELQARHEP